MLTLPSPISQDIIIALDVIWVLRGKKKKKTSIISIFKRFGTLYWVSMGALEIIHDYISKKFCYPNLVAVIYHREWRQELAIHS